jgi:hypothetical protein
MSRLMRSVDRDGFECGMNKYMFSLEAEFENMIM